MPNRNRWRLVTTRDLVAFHATRRDIYQTAADLLRGPVTRAHLEVLMPRLAQAAARSQGFPALERLREALALAAHSSTPIAHEHLLAPLEEAGLLVCPAEREAARVAALAHAGIAAASDRANDLLAMATLAGRTAGALSQNNFAEAAALSLVQAEFMRAHGGACLAGLADGLARSGTPLFESAGDALKSMIEDDLEYLAPAGME
jgi:hypothetical protein